MRTALMHAIGLVAFGIASRLLPHPPNLTAIGAVALKGRARFGPIGLLIPVVSMLAADAVIGFYDWRLLLSVYASYVLIGILGGVLERARAIGIAGIATCGSLLFFLITNTSVWALSSWYPHTPYGLLACLAAGIPFLMTMLAGDVIFSLALFKGAAYGFPARRRHAYAAPAQDPDQSSEILPRSPGVSLWPLRDMPQDGVRHPVAEHPAG